MYLTTAGLNMIILKTFFLKGKNKLDVCSA